MALGHYAIQPVGYFGLLLGVEVAVGLHRGLHALMAEAFRDQQRGEAHLYQQAGVGVSDVVNANLFHAGELAAALHFVGQVGLRVGEQPVVGLESVALCYDGMDAVGGCGEAPLGRDHAGTRPRMGAEGHP